MKLIPLDTSFTKLVFDQSSKERLMLETLQRTLRVERPGWQYDWLVKIGKKSKYDNCFTQVDDSTIVVNSGILEIPPVQDIMENCVPETPADFAIGDIADIDEFLEDLLESETLPFAPYPYQIDACRKALQKGRKLSLMCTGSGKSLTISFCLEYFRRKGLKGVLVVPNINLLTQFASDIQSYNLQELHSSIITFGGGSKKLKQLKDSGESLKSGDLVITTWQSLSKLDNDFFNNIDFVICDEVHKFSSACTSALVEQSKNAQYKLGFTGTLPDAKLHKMTLIGLFGVPETIITSSELIGDGRGTPICITGVKLSHSGETASNVADFGEYLDKLKCVISVPERNAYIANIAKSASEKAMGSTLVLFTLIEHGEALYKAIAGVEEIPDLATMQSTGIFFMSGQTPGKQREQIRLLMDQNPKAILVANYALLSTGVNIKSLRFAIFASPVKSAVVVAQSLGRGIRLNEGKEVFNVYDIVDVIGGCRIFQNQYNARKRIYQKSNFELLERVDQL